MSLAAIHLKPRSLWAIAAIWAILVLRSQLFGQTGVAAEEIGESYHAMLPAVPTAESDATLVGDLPFPMSIGTSPNSHLLAPPGSDPTSPWETYAGETPSSNWRFHHQIVGRAYYSNDQRIEITGQEMTFGVEGLIRGGVHQEQGDWNWQADAELFFNQPYERNILTDTPLRQSYYRNFDIEPFQISQLYVGARRSDLFFAAGKFVTPFGRFHYPIYHNTFVDSPFIRSEAILYRETGLLAQWDPDGFVFTAALTNGGFERDTNSSKAVIARVGIDWPNFTSGLSAKYQDGIGSEDQKLYNNHFGVDAMIRLGSWTFSAEGIYDEYGFRDTTYDISDIFWGRSLYNRELNNEDQTPNHGVGFYLNVGYEGKSWRLALNYGEFHPNAVGDRVQDITNRRGLVKAAYHWNENWEFYNVMIQESWALIDDTDGRSRIGWVLLNGFQCTF